MEVNLHVINIYMREGKIDGPEGNKGGGFEWGEKRAFDLTIKFIIVKYYYYCFRG